MNRFKHRSRLPRPVRQPAHPRGQGWQIGPAPQRKASELGTRFNLAFPVVIDGETRASLTTRHPTQRDYLWFGLQRGEGRECVLRMVARLCNISREAIDDLDSADLSGLLDVCDAVMGEN